MLPFLLGTTAGLALGLVGGGGSTLTVPLLVGVLGLADHARSSTTGRSCSAPSAWAS